MFAKFTTPEQKKTVNGMFTPFSDAEKPDALIRRSESAYTDPIPKFHSSYHKY